MTTHITSRDADTWAVFTMTAMSATQASKATTRARCGEGPTEPLRSGDVGAVGLRWLWGPGRVGC